MSSDVRPAAGKGEVALALHLRQRVDGLLERLVGEGAEGVGQVADRLQLVEHALEVAGVAQQALEQAQQVGQVDVLLDFLQLLDGEVERLVGDRRDIAHQFGTLLALALGLPRLLAQVGHLDGQRVDLGGQLDRDVAHGGLASEPSCRPWSYGPAAAVPAP